MLEKVGYKVVRLHRTSVMGIRCDGIAPGHWRPLNKAEMKLVGAALAEADGRSFDGDAADGGDFSSRQKPTKSNSKKQRSAESDLNLSAKGDHDFWSSTPSATNGRSASTDNEDMDIDWSGFDVEKWASKANDDVEFDGGFADVEGNNGGSIDLDF